MHYYKTQEWTAKLQLHTNHGMLDFLASSVAQLYTQQHVINACDRRTNL